MLCAFAGPTPGSRASTSGGAVFRFTAPSTAFVAARATARPRERRTAGRKRARARPVLGRFAPRVARAAARLRARSGAQKLVVASGFVASTMLPFVAGLAALVAAAAVAVARARLRALALLVRLLDAHSRRRGRARPARQSSVRRHRRRAVEVLARRIARLREVRRRRERADARRPARARRLVAAGDRAVAAGLREVARARAVGIAVDAGLAVVADVVAAASHDEGQRHERDAGSDSRASSYREPAAAFQRRRAAGRRGTLLVTPRPRRSPRT